MNKKRQDMAAESSPRGRRRALDSPEDQAKRVLIGQRIRQHRQARDWTLTELQNRSGINNGNLSKIENGIQSLSNKTMEALADAFGLTIKELLEKDVSDAKAEQIVHTAMSTGVNVQYVGEFRRLADIPETCSVAIGTIDVQPEAASDEVVFTRNDRIVHPFHGGTIAQIAAEPQHLVAFEIPDDVMAPRLYTKDLVVIDLNDRTVPMSGGVFAIVLDNETVAVRRLMPFVNRGLRVMCDNRNYPEMTLNGAQAASVYIAGRVKSMRGNGGF